jgi:hypothetical protein
MRPDQKIITQIPLTELWDEGGTVTDQRVRNLDVSHITELLRTAAVQFVVADCGLKLKWIPTQQRLEFWKTVQPHIAEPGKPIYLKQFPDEIAYSASEWRGLAGECPVLLEKHH